MNWYGPGKHTPCSAWLGPRAQIGIVGEVGEYQGGILWVVAANTSLSTIQIGQILEHGT